MFGCDNDDCVYLNPRSGIAQVVANSFQHEKRSLQNNINKVYVTELQKLFKAQHTVIIQQSVLSSFVI